MSVAAINLAEGNNIKAARDKRSNHGAERESWGQGLSSGPLAPMSKICLSRRISASSRPTGWWRPVCRKEFGGLGASHAELSEMLRESGMTAVRRGWLFHAHPSGRDRAWRGSIRRRRWTACQARRHGKHRDFKQRRLRLAPGFG